MPGWVGRRLAIFLLALGLAGLASSFGFAEEGDKGVVSVDLVAAQASDAWLAAALEETLTHELARFHRLSLGPKIDLGRCKGGDESCRVAGYSDGGVDVVILGTLAGGRLHYATYETWSGSLVSRGSFRVGGTMDKLDLLKAELGKMVRPIVANGGALDRRPGAKVTQAAGSALPMRVPGGLPAIFGLLALFVASPPLLLLGMVPRKSRKGHPRPGSWIWSVWLIGLFLGLAAVSFLPEGRKLTSEGWKIVAPWLGPGLSLIGGLLWGWLVIINGRLLFPRLGSGIERVRHEALFPLLGAWLRTVAARAVLLFAYAPAVVVAVIAGKLLGLDERTAKILLIPLAGLLCVFWLLSLVDNLTLYLDVKLVDGVAGERNAWHATVRRYFRGYVRRGGVDLAPTVVDGLLFLPAGTRNGVTCYGGGFARPRILIGPDAREAALGPLPDEAEMPERSANPEELPMGLILPDLATGRKAGPGWRRDLSERLRKQATLAPARAKAIIPRSIGENATLLGWVLPTTSEEGIPLISDSSEDFQVVRELLTEHYSGFEKDHRDEEYDDTDPTQKDFLFGPLLRETGRVLRGESLFETVLLAVDVEWNRISILTRVALAPFLELYQRLLSGGPAMLADAWAGLNGGRDHLLQHLFRERSGNEGYLTTRADTPRLYQRSKEMVLAVAGEVPKGPETQPLRATLRNRILWLGELLYTTLPEREGARRRVVVRTSLATGALLILLAIGVKQAVDYHPVWVARMNEAEARAAEQKAEKNKGEANGGSGGGTQAQGK